MLNEGEPLTQQELDKCLSLLCGDDVGKALKSVITSDEFSENILGFEEVDEEEEEGIVEDGFHGHGRGMDGTGMGVIPEEAGY